MTTRISPREFKALVAQLGPRLTINTTPEILLALIGQVQIAALHPRNHSLASALARRATRELIRTFPLPMQPLLNDGWQHSPALVAGDVRPYVPPGAESRTDPASPEPAEPSAARIGPGGMLLLASSLVMAAAACGCYRLRLRWLGVALLKRAAARLSAYCPGLETLRGEGQP